MDTIIHRRGGKEKTGQRRVDESWKFPTVFLPKQGKMNEVVALTEQNV